MGFRLDMKKKNFWAFNWMDLQSWAAIFPIILLEMVISYRLTLMQLRGVRTGNRQFKYAQIRIMFFRFGYAISRRVAEPLRLIFTLKWAAWQSIRQRGIRLVRGCKRRRIGIRVLSVVTFRFKWSMTKRVAQAMMWRLTTSFLAFVAVRV